MIVAILNIYLFFGLMALAAVSFRRLILSHSGNRWLYGAVCGLALLSAITAAITVAGGASAAGQMFIALALLVPAWMVIRSMAAKRRAYRYAEQPSPFARATRVRPRASLDPTALA